MTRETSVRCRSFEHSDFLRHSSFERRHFLCTCQSSTSSFLSCRAESRHLSLLSWLSLKVRDSSTPLGMTKSNLAPPHLPVFDKFVGNFLQKPRWPLENVAIASA